MTVAVTATSWKVFNQTVDRVNGGYGDAILIWQKVSHPSPDEVLSTLLNCKEAATFAADSIGELFDMTRFCCVIVVADPELANAIKTGESRSVVARNVISEIRTIVSLFPAWAVAVKPKGK